MQVVLPAGLQSPAVGLFHQSLEPVDVPAGLQEVNLSLPAYREHWNDALHALARILYGSGLDGDHALDALRQYMGKSLAASPSGDILYSTILHSGTSRWSTLYKRFSQAIREQYIGNSRCGAENSRQDSEHSQSAAFLFCLP